MAGIWLRVLCWNTSRWSATIAKRFCSMVSSHMKPKRSVKLCSIWFRLKGTRNGQRQQRLYCGSWSLWRSPHRRDLFAKKLQSYAIPIGYCFPVLLWCCQCSLNLLIAFHQSGPEPQNACSALPRRQGSDSLFFLQDVSLTGSRNTDPAARCWGSLTAGSMRGWIFSTGSNIFNIFSLSLNWIHSESIIISFTR